MRDGRLIRGIAGLVVAALLAHALAYLSHEYAHSITAWALGCMENPFGIDYGSLTFANAVLLGDVDDNVPYKAIFAAGKPLSAACVALAGPFVGNGVVYLGVYALMARYRARLAGWPMSFVFWLLLMCAGNVWSYVPVRALTTHADIALAAQGLGISVWALFPPLMCVSLALTWHFFCRVLPMALPRMTSGAEAMKTAVIAATGAWYFIFFGAGGLSGSYGLISQVLSLISCFFLFPLSVAWMARENPRAA